jgi:hypothetical protein
MSTSPTKSNPRYPRCRGVTAVLAYHLREPALLANLWRKVISSLFAFNKSSSGLSGYDYCDYECTFITVPILLSAIYLFQLFPANNVLHCHKYSTMLHASAGGSVQCWQQTPTDAYWFTFHHKTCLFFSIIRKDTKKDQYLVRNYKTICCILLFILYCCLF